jgi:hypothetical protein
MRPDVQEVKVDQGLDQAMQGYRRFLEETPETSMTPEAMRRLADLQIEKQFGIHTGDLKPRDMTAPKTGQAPANTPAHTTDPAAAVADAGPQESIGSLSGAQQWKAPFSQAATPTLPWRG